MVGYGPEDTHFVVELTYNYGIHAYDKGNDFVSMTIRSKEALKGPRKRTGRSWKETSLKLPEDTSSIYWRNLNPQTKVTGWRR